MASLAEKLSEKNKNLAWLSVQAEIELSRLRLVCDGEIELTPNEMQLIDKIVGEVDWKSMSMFAPGKQGLVSLEKPLEMPTINIGKQKDNQDDTNSMNEMPSMNFKSKTNKE